MLFKLLFGKFWLKGKPGVVAKRRPVRIRDLPSFSKQTWDRVVHGGNPEGKGRLFEAVCFLNEIASW